MSARLPHIDWLHNTGQKVQTADGREVEVWELTPGNDEGTLSAWAAHFRNHYIDDDDLVAMAGGTGLSKANYLLTLKFPDAKQTPGPSVRSGDFAEILVADYIEYVLGFWCPRELRYQDRWNRNDSTKGCDVVGFYAADPDAHNENDQLFIFEAKAALTTTTANRLQDAIDDSIKDVLREAMTLNAIKQRFHQKGDTTSFLRVQRFQNMTDRPFRRINGAAAVLENGVFDPTLIAAATALQHPNRDNLKLLVIRGPSLMTLAHALYDRAANEA